MPCVLCIQHQELEGGPFGASCSRTTHPHECRRTPSTLPDRSATASSCIMQSFWMLALNWCTNSHRNRSDSVEFFSSCDKNLTKRCWLSVETDSTNVSAKKHGSESWYSTDSTSKLCHCCTCFLKCFCIMLGVSLTKAKYWKHWTPMISGTHLYI